MDIGKIGKKSIELSKSITRKAVTTIGSVEMDSNAIIKHMDSIGVANKAVIKPFDLSNAQKQLQERLNRLDTETALHRFEGDNQRFGKDGILHIMQNATSKENIALINVELDKLEQGKSIWTADIINMFPQSKLFAGPISSILTKKSTIAEVIELEEKMKKMGYNANFSNNLEAAEIITRAYETLTKKGIRMPNDIQLMIPANEGVLGFRPYAIKGKEFETPILFNKNLGKKNGNVPFALAKLGIKHNATDSPESVVYHEVGHFLHDFSKKSIDESVEIWKKYAKGGYDLDLAKEVGYYAMTGDRYGMGKEYVAEVFAGLMDGKHYSDRVMEIYHKLGGPQVK
ncbi:hypothetical protein IJ425_06830 [bacterium]|nr:hypothetical protein [bacterium]